MALWRTLLGPRSSYLHHMSRHNHSKTHAHAHCVRSCTTAVEWHCGACSWGLAAGTCITCHSLSVARHMPLLIVFVASPRLIPSPVVKFQILRRARCHHYLCSFGHFAMLVATTMGIVLVTSPGGFPCHLVLFWILRLARCHHYLCSFGYFAIPVATPRSIVLLTCTRDFRSIMGLFSNRGRC